MNPLIKWPGGKSSEIKQIKHLIPEFNRYVEPFFGGGALYFYLKPQNAAINDISETLMDYYSLLKIQDKQFLEYLNLYNLSFNSLVDICEYNYSDISKIFFSYKDQKLEVDNLKKTVTALVLKLFDYDYFKNISNLILSEDEFLGFIIKMSVDKIKRTVTNDKKASFSDDDLKNNLITGFTSGYYMYFRKIYNDINLGRNTSVSKQYKVANFYFIREYCYGSMFRYNRQGEFNIPYGGISYNRKNFKEKIDNMFNNEVEDVFDGTDIYCTDFEDFLDNIELNSDDFMFLDPPYDTNFSNYEGKDFTKKDQERLAEALKKTKAQFILVIKNTEFIYSLYKDIFQILTFDNQYTYNVRSRNNRNVEHLIITNLPI